MKIKSILSVVILVILMTAGCSPEIEDKRPRYDESVCPFCKMEAGVCNYCTGSGDCPFCGGDGVREVSTENYPGMEAEAVTYKIECPFCKGDGDCPYCNGSGECWACDGNGKVEEWNFYQKYKQMQKRIDVHAQSPEPDTLSTAKNTSVSADEPEQGENQTQEPEKEKNTVSTDSQE